MASAQAATQDDSPTLSSLPLSIKMDLPTLATEERDQLAHVPSTLL